MTKLLEGKNALVFGVANDRSIAWGCAKALHEHGAKVGLSYAGEILKKRVVPLAESIGSSF
ncbi:MAG TPA: SDR family oxidoreductase, partial [Anaerolineales bacterium]|nr:SDR family oxidoreductase [Anaerolineales bacterium]